MPGPTGTGYTTWTRAFTIDNWQSMNTATNPFMRSYTMPGPYRGTLINFCGIPCIVVLARPDKIAISPLGVPRIFPVAREMLEGNWTPREPVHA